ncbi:MAG: hypothetical protein R2813_10175 [Flavobacteriales bacterium]
MRIRSFLFLGVMAAGCSPMSQSVMDTNIGFNGSFEDASNGLPVNWIVYTPQTVPEGKFKVSLDSNVAADGSQSILFEVDECSDKGGRLSPGLSTEIKAEPNQPYKFSFLLKNEGTTVEVRAGGISNTFGEVRPVLLASQKMSEWRQFEFEINPGSFEKLRFEFSVLAPGNLWIDNVKCEKIKPVSGE